jgi:hypothetical protein
MKKDMNDKTFIKVCEHILTNLRIIDGSLYPECFDDYVGASIKDYVRRAKKKSIDFALSNQEFYNIVSRKCYLCGKENSEFHNNGIDRLYNDIGYSIYNGKPCCGTCNYVKREYELYSVLNKIINICVCHKIICPEKIITSVNNVYMELVKPCKFNNDKKIDYDDKAKERLRKRRYRYKQRKKLGNDVYKEKMRIEKLKQLGKLDPDNKIPPKRKKKTKEEIREAARLRKQKQRQLLKEKYGDEEYRKIHAQEIAKNRAKKKQEL